jgi:hypothetical protein
MPGWRCVHDDAGNARSAQATPLCKHVGERIATAMQRHIREEIAHADDERAGVWALVQLLAQNAPGQLERAR